jgi:hypothetical protein
MARKPAQRPATYENSPMDRAEDQHGAGLLNITPAQYERTVTDKLQDIVGQRRLNRAVATQRVATAVVAAHKGKKR